MENLDLYFDGLDAVRCEAGGMEFTGLYDEEFMDDDLGGSVYGENVPMLTTQERFVKGMVVRGTEFEITRYGVTEMYQAMDRPRYDGAGLAYVPLSRL